MKPGGRELRIKGLKIKIAKRVSSFEMLKGVGSKVTE